ncbi:hypothetical protein Syun_028517 [Stephania yunnanensis]|uniref:MOSC domain-containing protein n=1 Tax=Stephania yunnanensis TaxID=152371 RepID=A0AAP0EHI8_9MAGN
MAERASATISSIFIYPIKSCRGISVPRAPLSPTGLKWDRQWLVVNSKGRAYTQRVEPKLALVQVELPNEAFEEDWVPGQTSYMVIRGPGMEALKVSLSKPCKVVDGISCWEWSGSALDEGPEASLWFSRFLGNPTRLVRFNAASETRAVDPAYGRGYKTMFSDEYPFMLLSQVLSLCSLGLIFLRFLKVFHFQCLSFLVNGCKPFSEDLWTEIKINKLTFHGVKLCSRCKVPTINQENGIAGSEPSEALTKFRSDKVLRPNGKQQGKVYFGQNLVCKDSLTGGKGKVIRVGDPVFVVKQVHSPAEAAA